MGKLTYKGLVPPDDPMFTGGVELFRKTDASPPQSCFDENEPSHVPFKPHREFSVDWGGKQYTLGVDKVTWKRIYSGKEVTIEVYEEKIDMYIHWHFNSDPEHNLILDYGDPNNCRWFGQTGQALTTQLA